MRFFIAQLLCFYTAEKDGITETWPLPQPKVVSITPEYAIDRVQQQLDDSFREPLRDFASFSCPPVHGPRGATLALLYLLHASYKESTNESLRGTTSLAAAESRFPNLHPCLRWLGDDDRLAARFEDQENDNETEKKKKATLREVLFYNSGVLSAGSGTRWRIVPASGSITTISPPSAAPNKDVALRPVSSAARRDGVGYLDGRSATSTDSMPEALDRG